MDEKEFGETLAALLSPNMESTGVTSFAAIPEDKNLMEMGMIDSISLVGVLLDLEEKTDISVDFGAQEPDLLLTIGGLKRLFCNGGD